MAAHHFDDEPLRLHVAEFIAAFCIDDDDAVKIDLTDRFDDASFQLLAQPHAKHRRLGWVVVCFVRQMDAGVRRMR
ncbi:hypothetical protein LR69_02646 [Geobacillus sp. BCO2]|nr:hypothetical protein LR69_02646 [Geobacillus sp. BCO2]